MVLAYLKNKKLPGSAKLFIEFLEKIVADNQD